MKDKKTCGICFDCSGCHCFDEKISQAFKIDVFSYNGEVTEEFWKILCLVCEGEPAFVTDIAKETGLKPSHVELIQYLICNFYDGFDYGSSPRGVWANDEGKKLYEELKELKSRQDSYYAD